MVLLPTAKPAFKVSQRRVAFRGHRLGNLGVERIALVAFVAERSARINIWRYHWGVFVDNLIIPATAVTFIALLTIYFHIKYNEKSINYGPTILTTAGIFATFFGIAVGLLTFDAGRIQESVPALISGLKTAFWGSVFGVGGALTIKFRQLVAGNPSASNGTGSEGEVTADDLAVLLKNIQQSLVGNDDSTLITQIKLARQENNDRLDALKKAQNQALEKLSELGSKALIQALQDVIRDFNEKLTEQFGENFKQLNQAVEKLLLWQEQYRNHIEEVGEQNKITTAAMKESAAHYSDLVGKAEIFSRVSVELGQLLTGLEVQREQLVQSMRMLGELIKAASDGLPQIESKIMQFTEQMTSAVIRNQTELNKSLQENATQIRSSIEASKADMSKFNTEISKEISGLVAKTKEQVATLDAALAEELKKSLESLGRQLAALSEKFVSDYGPLTDRLRDLVRASERV